MKFVFFSFLFVILFAFGAHAAEQGMNATGTAFVKAFQANDLDSIMALYADTAEMFPPDSMEAKGKEEIRKSYAGLLERFTIQNFQVLEAQHETNGNLSFGWGRFAMDMLPKGGGEKVHMEGRFSDVSKKINGKWMYVLDHASVPFASSPSAPPPVNQ
jgi:ketosteroid isomerase-like protein